MYYTIYKITNLVSNKIYIGAHKTNNINDGYMSSSKIVKNAVIKYGLENFKKEILFELDNEIEMYKMEMELVSEDFISRNDVYNLKIGGIGGWGHITTSVKHKEYVKKAGNVRKAQMEKYGNPFDNIQTKNNFKLNEPHRLKASLLANSEEAKEKRKKTFKENMHGQGNKNSQYGTRFYIDGSYNGEKIDLSNIEYCKRFFPGNEPIGWVLLSVWKDNKKRKSGTYGKKWYNDGVNNYYIGENDFRITDLIKGRLMEVK